MYAFIKGKIDLKQTDYIVIECNGIGYKVFIPSSEIGSIGDIGEEIKLYTHLYIRENLIQMYGFKTNEQLQMFELLITVSGVGAKAAISILSEVPPFKFSLAVVGNDAKTLTKAQGVGPKMAQRIILELKDKIKSESIENMLEEDMGDVSETSSSGVVKEAIEALQFLGYAAFTANKAVNKVYREDMALEDVIKLALKELA